MNVHESWIIYVTGSGKRRHFTQKLKNELLTWCYSAYLASQNSTYHRAWSPTIAELHALVLSHLQENFNYCIIRKQRFFNYLCSTRDTYPYTRINWLRGRGAVFFPEWVSVFKPRACLLRVASGASNFAWRETKDQSYSWGKKIFFVKYKLFFCIALRTVILKNRQLRQMPPFRRACHIFWSIV